MKVPPTVGMREANRSTTSVEGVMGYPEEKRAPAASAPSQQAWSPSMKWTPVRTPFGSAFILCVSGLGGLRDPVSVNREIRTVHSAQIAPATFLGVDDVRWMVTLGVECGGKS